MYQYQRRQGALGGPQLYSMGFDWRTSPDEPPGVTISEGPPPAPLVAATLAFPLIMTALTLGGGYLIYRALKK